MIEIVRKRICRQAAMVADLKELIKLHKKMVIDRSSWTVLKVRKDRQLISEILVYDRNRVEIHFKFKDEWENLLETTRIDLLQKKF